MPKKDSDPDEVEREDPTVLPAREAMSIISPTPSTGEGFLPDMSSPPTPPDPTETAGSAATDAEASGSGQESVTSEERDEHVENRDSASSET